MSKTLTTGNRRAGRPSDSGSIRRPARPGAAGRSPDCHAGYLTCRPPSALAGHDKPYLSGSPRLTVDGPITSANTVLCLSAHGQRAASLAGGPGTPGNPRLSGPGLPSGVAGAATGV